jgi:hypothetical protein
LIAHLPVPIRRLAQMSGSDTMTPRRPDSELIGQLDRIK